MRIVPAWAGRILPVAALLLPQIFPISSVVAPCHRQNAPRPRPRNPCRGSLAMVAVAPEAVQLEQRGELAVAGFRAMASPCEVLLATRDQQLARRLGELAAHEAWRIERKYSRYRDDSVTGI